MKIKYRQIKKGKEDSKKFFKSLQEKDLKRKKKKNLKKKIFKINTLNTT